MPAVIPCSSGPSCFGSLLLRTTRSTIMGAEDQVCRTSKHFIFRITEKTLGPDIPAGGNTLSVHRKDRKVYRALDNKLKQLLLARYSRKFFRHAHLSTHVFPSLQGPRVAPVTCFNISILLLA